MLPTHKPRFAVTLWFIDGKERDHTAAMQAAAAAVTNKQATGVEVSHKKGNIENKRDWSAQELPVSPGSQQEKNHAAEGGAPEMPVSPVTLLSDDNGEVASWCAQEQCLLYQVHFSDPSLVPHTLVDVVSKSVLLIHIADNSFSPIEVPIHLPSICAHYSIQESKTTAKYSRKKSILSVRLFFIA